MIPQFQDLNTEEVNALLDAIPMVTVLIAGADGEIDSEERKWGAKMTKIRSYAHPENLQAYYEAIGETYENRVNELISSLPDDTDQRNEAISEKLSQLNPILAKLDQNFAKRMYESLTSFAEHVAKASGGFLRIGSISKEEKQWINLPMITPIIIEETEEEEPSED